MLAGLCLFAYQSLDAIDGKQARRTGSATPLGELFDHGCDALSVGEELVVDLVEFITAWCMGFFEFHTALDFFLNLAFPALNCFF